MPGRGDPFDEAINDALNSLPVDRARSLLTIAAVGADATLPASTSETA